MNVQQVANELEILLLGLVDSRGDNSVNERIDQAKACLGKLIAAHDAAQASEVKPAVDLEGHLNNFPDAAYPLEEKRGEKRAIVNLLVSDTSPSPHDVMKDLAILIEQPDSGVKDSCARDEAFVLQKLIEEFGARQTLLQQLKDLQSEHDELQRNVSLKTESATKLASMVQEVTGKASEALFNLNVDLQHLPKKQMTSQVDVLTPLHVLFQQFCNIRAIYEDQLQVEVNGHSPESLPSIPGHQVQVIIPAPGHSCTGPCTVYFSFHEGMNAVLAYSPSHPQILPEFDPSDSGTEWPNEVTPVHRTASVLPEIPMPWKPFRWCQKLAGLELLVSPSVLLSETQGGVTRTVEGFIWRIQHLLSAA